MDAESRRRLEARGRSLILLPPDSFLSDIMGYRDARVAPGRYRQPDDRPVYHADMSPETLESYLSWRTGLNAGEDVPADWGFAWLRICEIANTVGMEGAGFGSSKLLDEVAGMVGRFRGTPVSVMAANASKDLALLLGLDWDCRFMWSGRRLRGYAVHSALNGRRQNDIDVPVIAEMCGDERILEVPDRATFSTLFTRCARAVVSNHGFDAIADDRSEDVMLFDGFAYLAGPERITVHYRSYDTDRWRATFLGIAAAVCERTFWDWDGPGVGPIEAMDSVDLQVAMDALGSEAQGEWTQWDEPVFAETPSTPAEIQVLGSVAPKGRLRNVRASGRFFKDLESNRTSVGRVNAPYVESGSVPAQFSTMTPAQRDFYLSWRDEVSAGVFRGTDEGYLWLLLCDLVDSWGEPQEVMGILLNLRRAYAADGGWPAETLDRVILDYADLHMMDPAIGPPEGTDASRWNQLDRCVTLKLLLRSPGTMTARMLDGWCGGKMGRFMDPDADYDTLLNVLLGGMWSRCEFIVSDEIGMRGTSYTTLFNYMPHRSTTHATPALKPKNLSGASWIARTCLAYTIRAVNRELGLKGWPSRCTFGRNHEGMDEKLEGIYREHSRSVRRQDLERWMDGFSIDMRAVSSAEDDLDAVRTLMVTEDEVEPEVPSEPVPEPAMAADGPWSAFVGSLSDDALGYLSSLLDGVKPVADVLKRGALEEEINTAAMDTVGDVVVETGSLVEDYEDDLRAALTRLGGGPSSS